jgi:hypothetical protein
MNDVEFTSVLDHVIDQNEFPSNGILALLVFAKRAPYWRNEPRACH